MTSRGIEVSENGIDIARAQDSQKVMDSRWRYMEILQEVVLTLPTLSQTSGAQEIYKHNLGFLPAFDVYDTLLGAYIDEPGSDGSGLISDTNRIYFNSFYVDRGWSGHKVIIRIYNIPITDEYEAPVAQTLPAVAPSKSKFGIKSVRASKDFTNGELSDFTLNTQGKGLAVQKTGLATSNSGTNFLATIKHNMGLPPTFLATYADIKGQWVGVIDPDLIPVKSTSDNTNMVFKGFQSALIGTFAYVIFKELGDFAI